MVRTPPACLILRARQRRAYLNYPRGSSPCTLPESLLASQRRPAMAVSRKSESKAGMHLSRRSRHAPGWQVFALLLHGVHHQWLLSSTPNAYALLLPSALHVDNAAPSRPKASVPISSDSPREHDETTAETFPDKSQAF